MKLYTATRDATLSCLLYVFTVLMLGVLDYNSKGGGFNQPLPLVPQWGYELACMSKGQSDSECHCLRRHKFLCQCGLLKWRLGQVDFETLPLVISEII